MNIASVLKAEIARVARKTLRDELTALRKASTHYRADIAALKRRIAELEKRVKAGSRRRAEPEAAAAGEEGGSFRFRPQGLAAKRKQLGLSAADFGKLVGVTGQTIYKWEQGTSRPRAAQAAAIQAVRKLGKREAAAKL